MDDNQNGLICALGGWGLAMIAGLLAAVLLMLLGDWRFIQALFAFAVISVVLGCLMMWIVCRPLPAQGTIPASNDSTNPTPSSAQSAARAADAAKAGAVPEAPAGTAKAAADAAKAGVKPSQALAGEAELSARKGEWRYTGGDDASTAGKTGSAKEESAPAAGETSDNPAKAADKPAKAPAKKAAKKSKPKPADETAAQAAGDTPEPNTGSEAKRPTAAESAASDTPATEESEPEVLSAPRGGVADDLKKIKGVGPGLEKVLNELGFWHFAQIADWGEQEVAWVDSRLKFKGRIKRDDWITQAKALAKGDTV